MKAEKDIRIALTYDFDSYTTWIGTFGATSPSMLSRGEFGPIGLHRILDVLKEFKAPATFFTPGATAASYPRCVEAIQKNGHEVAHHGWVHENPVHLSKDDERRVLERGIEALEKVTGIKPVGYRSPAWDNSPNTVELLMQHGFEYESSLMGNDYSPYWCRVGDKWSTTEPFVFGKPVSLVEMPVAWHLDDWPQYEYIPGSGAQGLRPPSVVMEIWKGEFDYLYNQIGKGILNITMHPQVTGRGHRLTAFSKFLEYLVSHSGVSFTTCLDYVKDWKRGKTPSLPVDVG